jgi:hypothetical protein
VTTNKSGLLNRELLSEEQCRDRLAAAEMARVLISIRCLPAARPVALELGAHHVVIASAEETVIEAARRGDVMAVQIDGTDPDGTTWTVQVTGPAHLPEQTDQVVTELGDRLRDAATRGATLVALPLTVLSGERLHWTFPVPRSSV